MLAMTEINKIEESLFPEINVKPPVIRIMPNLNVSYSKGVAAVCGNSSATVENLDIICDMFNKLGAAYIIEERDFPVFTAIASAGPAFVYLFIESMAKAACKYGMKKKTATEICAKTVMGGAYALFEEFTEDEEYIIFENMKKLIMEIQTIP
jgi:pyrroline-5-carboxylate reductase